MKREAKSGTSTNTVRWNYLANDGRKAERYGPYLLQADIERSFVDSRGLAQREVVPLGVVSVELINEVAHRHAFWVISKAALDSLELEKKRANVSVPSCQKLCLCLVRVRLQITRTSLTRFLEPYENRREYTPDPARYSPLKQRLNTHVLNAARFYVCLSTESFTRS